MQVKVAPHPYGLALSPDGKTLVTLNNGVAPFSISILTGLGTSSPQVVQIPPGYKTPNADPESVFLGIAVAPDNNTVYISEGNNGRVGAFDLTTHHRLWSVGLDGEFDEHFYRNSFSGDLRLSPDGRRLYILDIAHFRMVTLDTQSKKIIASLSVGRFPFGLALSADGRRAYVTNVGMFRYHMVPGFDPTKTKETGLDFPPFGFPSPESENGTVISGKKISGLGNPNNPASNSVWVVDVSNSSKPRVISRVQTGSPVGPDSAGGSSPGAVVAGRNKIFVSNANQDSISILNAQTNRVEKTVVLEPTEILNSLRGVIPFGMALSPDEKRLYVACGGINAVAVMDTDLDKVIGYIPTAWFPARVLVSKDGNTLYVANAKGFGAGPNGGRNFQPGPEGSYIGDITMGEVSIIPTPSDAQLEDMTRKVLLNNGFLAATDQLRRANDSPVPLAGRPSSKIHHVIFIIKENRTFDEVFGDLGSINGQAVNGEADIARWGLDAMVKGENEPTLDHVRVTPNEHALARRFAISDNYFVDSDVSFDGHRWLQGDYPDELVESEWPAGYGGKFDLVPDNDAPGRLEMGGSSSPQPEDYVENGSIWDHFVRHHIIFRNYGEDVGETGGDDGPGTEPTGTREGLNMPMEEAVFKNTSRIYPNFNTSIPDQYRFEQFKREFDERYVSGKMPFPQFMYIWLPNDHTAKPRPADGYAYRASYVADNDLALGKLIDLISHSPFWKDTAIFVTEDDAQDGRDHVDAHRSVLLVISPYARNGVSHMHADMASILKTFDLIFGMPPLNQYDAAASDLSDMFTSEPNLSPYTALPSDTRIFDPSKARDPEYFAKAGKPLPPSAPLDDSDDIARRFTRRVRSRRH